ncbi:MAG: hypothetical protein RMJ48_19300 [Roseiflexaceae bacterium]|nr:hypothetical protein [Roseiflexaceae bacterium]
MNERIRIAIDHMRTHAVLPLRDPVQALELPGPGRSVLVALWSSATAPAFGVALLTPSDRQPRGWLPVMATVGGKNVRQAARSRFVPRRSCAGNG